MDEVFKKFSKQFTINEDTLEGYISGESSFNLFSYNYGIYFSLTQSLDL
jgi:hypothetical protein